MSILAPCRRSEVTEDGMGYVRLLEALHLVVGELQLFGGERVREVANLRGSDDRRGHAGLAEQPCERDLGGWHTPLGGHLGDALDHVEVGRLTVEVVRELVGLRARRAPFTVTASVAGEHAACKRAPRDHTHALVHTQGNHLAFLFAVDEVVVVLHRHKLRPAVALRDVLRLGELPSEHAAGPMYRALPARTT